MDRHIQVFTTIDSKKRAEKIANTLINDRLAACVQIVGPINSTYRWKDKVEHAEEWLCIAKSKSSLFPKIEKAIKDVHSYSLPEITMSEIKGSKEYLSWIEHETM